MNIKFINALETKDKKELAKIPKYDLHHHAVFSCDRNYLEYNNYSIPESENVKDISSLISFARNYIKPIQNSPHGLTVLINGMIQKCLDTGVLAVDTDIDYKICLTLFNSNVNKFINFLSQFKPSNLQIKWIIDISRDSFIKELHESLIVEMLESKFFAGIDLSSTENCKPNADFVSIYTIANNLNLKTKVHAGEQLGVNYIKECILDFNPKEIQHGITIVEDEQIMQLAKDKGVVFNVCPTSNVVLGYAKSIETHPIKQMVEYGLNVTIGTDDFLFFESDINDEYLKLYNNKVLTAEQLDKIRETSLKL